jgi:hypothetical protein
MRKAICAPVCFAAANERERGEFQEQLVRLSDMYGDVAEFLAPACAREPLPKADAVVFPQLIGAAFKDRESLKKYNLPFVVLTSRFGTVEMWDWEIVSFFRGEGLTVFSPYNTEMAKVILRAIAAKSSPREGAKFVMFQDSPGEGMQAYIFKRFYWWEEECARKMEDAFGMKLIYRSWKEASDRARAISDSEARKVCADWNVNMEGVPEEDYLRAVKIYIAVKAITDEIGGVAGVGANCLNESFNCDTTPCLAWNMLFERDGLIWACEGDTLTLLSTYILVQRARSADDDDQHLPIPGGHGGSGSRENRQISRHTRPGEPRFRRPLRILRLRPEKFLLQVGDAPQGAGDSERLRDRDRLRTSEGPRHAREDIRRLQQAQHNPGRNRRLRAVSRFRLPKRHAYSLQTANA